MINTFWYILPLRIERPKNVDFMFVWFQKTPNNAVMPQSRGVGGPVVECSTRMRNLPRLWVRIPTPTWRPWAKPPIALPMGAEIWQPCAKAHNEFRSMWMTNKGPRVHDYIILLCMWRKGRGYVLIPFKLHHSILCHFLDLLNNTSKLIPLVVTFVAMVTSPRDWFLQSADSCFSCSYWTYIVTSHCLLIFLQGHFWKLLQVPYIIQVPFCIRKA